MKEMLLRNLKNKVSVREILTPIGEITEQKLILLLFNQEELLTLRFLIVFH